MRRRIRFLTTLVALTAMTVLSFAVVSPQAANAALPGQIVITEWMYNPANSAAEFVEVTNVGGEPVDMATYSFDDDSRAAHTFSLAGLGTLTPGESGLIVESSAAAFRTEWGLAPTVKIAESNVANLGRADEINIFDGDTLADRLTYGDQTFAGTIRTVGISGIPTSCLAEGANNVGLWKFSAVGDGLGTKTSASGAGDIGSPGTSPLNACGPVTIVGGNGTGSPNTLPCQPEAASGTGPAPANAQTWPGGSTVTVADQTCAWKTTTGPEGRDMSGLVFDPTNPDVLWGVKNKSWVFRLVKQNGVWAPDTANDWAAGKQIFFPGGAGQPDSEGLTVGADGALYITTERDNSNNSVSLDSVLRFDPTAAGTTLTPTTQWNLTADFPELLVPGKANLGFEGVAFVPDAYLVQNGFIDQSTGAAYNPGTYADHGSGLYFAALENDGKLYAYALNADGSSHRVAVVDTGMGHVMDVQYDRDLQQVWALCDNTCSVSSTLLKVGATGAMVPDAVYARPADLPNVNVEGFAIAPDSTCVDGAKEVVWSDDGISAPGHEGHALYRGTFPCNLPVVVPGVGTVAEGNSGTTTLSVPVTLSHPSSQTVTVEWETIDSFAQPKAGVDYEPASGTVTFAPGATSGTASFTVYGDTIDENMLYNAEWGGLTFHSPTNAIVGSGLDSVGFALILDDDPPPTIVTGAAAVSEGNVGDTTLLVTFALSAPSGQTVSVNWATIDSAAQPQAGVDFAPGSGTLTFAPGETSKSVPFVVHGETVDEPGQLWNAEWGGIQLSAPTNAVFGTGPLARIGFALIVDDD
jgi:hypothetical protein